MNYHNITYPDMNNGDGIRVVLWLSGCSHHCYNCQNPQTWNPDSGIPFDEDAKKEIFCELDKDYISGLTLTGGDPLHENNLSGVLNLLSEIKNYYSFKKNIWLYTGYVWEQIWKENQIKKRKDIVSICDVLIDGQYIESKRNIDIKWRGSENQRLINIKKSLANGKVIIYD